MRIRITRELYDWVKSLGVIEFIGGRVDLLIENIIEARIYSWGFNKGCTEAILFEKRGGPNFLNNKMCILLIEKILRWSSEKIE